MSEPAAPAPTVLLAEDDRPIRNALERALTLEGYAVTAVADGVEALAAAHRTKPDILVLDVMMPGIDGLQVCRVLRAEGDATPILMLTALVETPDRIAGLDAGADDYVVKPFDVEEVFARLRALLRRTKPGAAESPDDGTITAADLRIDPQARRAWRGSRELELTRTEFDLLELLARNCGIVLDHATIYDRIWGYDFGPGSKNLAVYVGYLRRKVDEPEGVPLLHTVRGVGYVLREG
ncbi:response regulator transcription factor [Streptomyces sp. NPDC052225]|uniref:response regulator transcription factor n=1 Tax=Streptomyces sp. NPDC052225 TaxID=3154949 RepID=UPI00344957A5